MIMRTDLEGAALSLTQMPPTSSDVTSLPGAAVVARIRRVLLVSLIAALVYPAFIGASAGYCAGGVDGEGGFVDAAGRPVDTAPACVELTLKPSPLVYVGIVLIVLFAISRVLKAPDEAGALRILDRSLTGVCVLVAVAIVVSQVWFHLIPIADFMAGTASVLSPFPFGFIDVANTPLPVP